MWALQHPKNRLTELSEFEAEPEQYANIIEVYEMRNSGRSYNKLPSGYMFYYASDDTKTTAGTVFYIPAS